MELHITHHLDFPQLPRLLRFGERFMASLDNITNALNDLSTVLDQELTEIAAALQGMQGPTQEEVDAVAARVLALKDRIAAIIP